MDETPPLPDPPDVRWGIRPAVAGDAAELLRMRQALWPDSSADEVGPLIAGELPRSYTVHVAERRGGGLAGFVEMAVREYADGCVPGPVAYLEGIWVDPDRRRTGLGAALVASVLTWAAGMGLRELASDTSVENTASQGFHRRTGFTEVARAVLYRRPVP